MNCFQEPIDITEITLFRVAAEPAATLNLLMNAQDIKHQYLLMQGLIKNSVILEALPFSSMVFYKEVLKFIQKPVAEFRKSERKIARKLIQYLIRAIYKNSPFHALGQIGISCQTYDLTFKQQQLFTFNDHIEQALHEYFIQKGHFSVTLNPTLEFNEAQQNFTFFMDQSGQEAILELETNAFLLDLFQHATLSKKYFVPLSSLAHEYAPYDKNEQKDIIEYLFSLVDIGFLIVIKEQLANHIFKVTESNIEQFLDTQIEIETKLGALEIRPESYYYIDKAIHIQHSNIDNTLIDNNLTIVNKLLAMAKSYLYQSDLSHVFHHQLSVLNEGEAMSFLSFYAWYCAQETTLREVTNYLNCTAEQLFSVTNFNDEHIFLELKNTKIDNFDQTAYTVFSSVAHVESTNQNLQIINAVGLGYGKFFGRFLDFINEKVTFKPNIGTLLVENADSTLFTANNKTRLFRNRITTPANYKGENGEILISDLEIRKTDNELQLIYKPLNEKVEILDLGLMHPNGRTALYRLLQYFERPKVSFLAIQAMLIKSFEKKIVDGIVYCPRIYLNQNIVLKRQQWVIDISVIDLKTLPVIHGYYGIPNKVFVVFSPRKYQENGFQDTDDHKPMYIQFDSPICLEIWKFGIKKTISHLILEEALPDNESYPNINGEPRAVELVNEIWA